MKNEYDLDKLKERPGKPKVDKTAAKTPVSIRLNGSIIGWFKQEAERLGIPYQTLMGSALHRFSTGELVDKEDIKKFG
jgi:predicted DNA binding CopG/RHH family protein